MKIITLENISKEYVSGKLSVPVLFDISLTVKRGEMAAIMGPSGSGKSTLLNIIGLLDRPTSGKLFLFDREIQSHFSDRILSQIRAERIGFVFQSFQLLPKLSALENVILPTLYGGNRHHAGNRARELLSLVGLERRVKHRPTELSGGERQRVAIARALINDPEILLADEPTGNLDSKSGMEVINILIALNLAGKTILTVTHDEYIARHCSRIIRLADGIVHSDDPCIDSRTGRRRR